MGDLITDISHEPFGDGLLIHGTDESSVTFITRPITNNVVSNRVFGSP
jgi:hypothetical protein